MRYINRENFQWQHLASGSARELATLLAMAAPKAATGKMAAS